MIRFAGYVVTGAVLAAHPLVVALCFLSVAINHGYGNSAAVRFVLGWLLAIGHLINPEPLAGIVMLLGMLAAAGAIGGGVAAVTGRMR